MGRVQGEGQSKIHPNPETKNRRVNAYLCGMKWGNTRLGIFTGHRDCIYALAAGLAPYDFFSSGADGWVVGWNLDKPETGKLLARMPGSVYCLGSDPEFALLLIGSNRDGFHFVNPASGEEVWNAGTPGRTWYRLVNLGDGTWMASGDEGWMARLDLVQQKVTLFRLGTANIRALSRNPKTGELAIGNSASEIYLFNPRDPKPVKLPSAHLASVFGLSFYPTGNQFVSCGRDARLVLWQQHAAGTWECQQNIPGHLFAIHDVQPSPTREIVASASTDKSIKIWDAGTLRILRVMDKTRFAAHGHSINQLLWLQNPEVLLSCSDDRTISAWDIYT